MHSLNFSPSHQSQLFLRDILEAVCFSPCTDLKNVKNIEVVLVQDVCTIFDKKKKSSK